MTHPETLSLTGGETHSPTQSHHPTPPLTCTVSPVPPSPTGQSRQSLSSPTPLMGWDMRLRDETDHETTSTTTTDQTTPGASVRPHGRPA